MLWNKGGHYLIFLIYYLLGLLTQPRLYATGLILLQENYWRSVSQIM